MLLDATDLLVGRMATQVAKKAMLGEIVEIVNCEKAIISGKRAMVFARSKQKKDFGRNPYKGPFFPRAADRMVKRVIRGMLPYKKARGLEAFKRVKCYIGVPVQLQNKKFETLKEANVSRLATVNYVTIGEISKHLGAKI